MESPLLSDKLLGTALGLPIVGVTLLYPVLAGALRTFLGGGA